VPEVLANGVSLYYEEHGAGDPILCIHGMGSAAAMWGEALPGLAAHGRAIAYDRRGCFRSERPEPYATDVHQQAEDAAALIDALDAAPAVVIGRSYGGEVALDLAVHHPERVRALALLEGVPAWMDEEGARWWEEVETELLAVADTDVGAVGRTLLGVVAGDTAWDHLPEEARDLFVANGPAIVAEARGGGLEVGLEELSDIGHPTLLVVAEESLPGVAEATTRLADVLPSATVAPVGGGHLISPAHPVVVDFVDEVLEAS
jgi:pimeloyl-ACP methyl ester carboxylesterase